MKSYVDYVFYKDTFKGNKITSEEEFNRLSLRATMYIKNVLLNKDYTNFNGVDYTEQVKYATCSLTEIEQDYQNSFDSLSLKSESIGDYSRSYDSQEELTKNTNEKRNSELSLYLGNTGLLYRGMCV